MSDAGFGTFVAMSLFTGLAGELSSQVGTQLENPNAPARLAMAASLFALAMGSFWIRRALLALGFFARL